MSDEESFPDSDPSKRGKEVLGELHFDPPVESTWHSPNGDRSVMVMGTYDNQSAYIIKGQWGGVPADEVELGVKAVSTGESEGQESLDLGRFEEGDRYENSDGLNIQIGRIDPSNGFIE